MMVPGRLVRDRRRLVQDHHCPVMPAAPERPEVPAGPDVRMENNYQRKEEGNCQFVRHFLGDRVLELWVIGKIIQMVKNCFSSIFILDKFVIEISITEIKRDDKFID